ncbi:MAG: hypothetical protein K6F84_07860 [Lachnospiraceae bacterium]|nr:hypothetical protein [Lachnospiraceae bacterium]
MKRLIICLIVIITIIGNTFLLTGCGNDQEALSKLTETVKDEGSSINHGALDFTARVIPESWYQSAMFVRHWTAVVVCGCELFGILLIVLFKKSREVQSMAFKLFNAGIPLIWLISVNVYCILYEVYN